MKKDGLGKSLGDSLSEKVRETAADISEVGIDLLIDNGPLREIPIISTVLNVYRIADSMRNRHSIKQLWRFIEELNNQATTEERHDEIRNKLAKEGKDLDKKVEFLLILIDRYIEENKPGLLSKLFLAYLDRKIDWNKLTAYATIIERLLPNDLETLISSERLCTNVSSFNDSILRLSAFGLIIEDGTHSLFTTSNQGVGITSDSMGYFVHGDKEYIRTPFGDMLVSIIR